MVSAVKQNGAAYISQSVVLFFSLSFGIWFITPGNILPTSMNWLRNGDIASAQFMWEYFRTAPLLQWPLTAIDAYGDGWGVVLAGHNVLPAFIFKLASPLLPANFQYLGLWALLNFSLQGYFAERLFSQLGLGIAERVLGAISLVVAPTFLFRFSMSHLDLASHWLILAALLLYFSPEKSKSPTSVYLLCALALLVNSYLFVMVFVISMATLVKRFMTSNRDMAERRALAMRGITLLVSSGVVAWLIGYFSLLNSAQGEGFFRMNLLAFFNPAYKFTDSILCPGYGLSESFSLIRDAIPPLSNRRFYAEEGEGFFYLGFVGICGVASMIILTPKFLSRRNLGVLMPLLVVALLLFLTALSDRVAIIRHEFQLPIPNLLLELRQVFRAATRFSWIAYYCLLLTGWVALCRLFSRRKSGPLFLAVVLLIGSVDQWKGVAEIRSTFLSGSRNESSMKSEDWGLIGESVSRMYLSPTFDFQDDELPDGAESWLVSSRSVDLLEFGARYRLVTNFAYVARPVSKQVETSNMFLQRAFERRTLPPDSVIFFARESDWKRVQDVVSAEINALMLDGFFIIVTGGDE